MTTTMPARERVTRPPADAVTVPCAECGAALTVTRDELREHCDRDTRPRHTTCPGVVLLPRATPTPAKPGKRTAADVVLLAAADLTAAGHPEFTEWDLTVAAWSLDRERFGLRGYEQSYPDHKRTALELVGTRSVVGQALLERTRPNHYRLTPRGREAAARLRKAGAA